MFMNYVVSGPEFKQLSKLVSTIKGLHKKHIMGWYGGFLVDQRYKYYGYLPEHDALITDIADSGLIYMDSEKCLRDAVELTLENRFGLRLDTVYMFKVNGVGIKLMDLYGKSVRSKLGEYEYRDLLYQAEELVHQGCSSGFIYYQ